MIAYQPMLWSEGAPVKASALPVTGQGSQERPGSCGNIYEQYRLSVLAGLSGRTSRERSQVAEGKISDVCSKPWMNSGIVSHGEYWTRSISEWPKDADVCLLSEVLEQTVPQKYYLSPKACAGIIRRAAKREKPLPISLEIALKEQIKGITV